MRLIDANVFIYAAGGPHRYRTPSQRVFASVRDGSLEANTDTEVLQEILHYYRTRRDVGFGRRVFQQAVDAFPRPFEITVPMLKTAADTLATHPHLQARDAVHIGVLVDLGLEGIISADRGFDVVPGVTRFDPLEL